MGLFDKSRRGPDAQAEHERDVLLRLGRLEADVESLKLQWASYRDELKRLVNRLEKRDQRAAQRAEVAPGAPNEAGPDPITAKILARRQRGVRSQRTDGEG